MYDIFCWILIVVSLFLLLFCSFLSKVLNVHSSGSAGPPAPVFFGSPSWISLPGDRLRHDWRQVLRLLEKCTDRGGEALLGA